MKKQFRLKAVKLLVAVMVLVLSFFGSTELRAENTDDTEELTQEETLKGTIPLTGQTGYFTVNINGDKKTSMKIKVSYPKTDISGKQKVKLSVVSGSTTNNHNLKIKYSSVETQQGSTMKKTEAYDSTGKGDYVTGYNSSGQLIYKTESYCVFVVTFTYDKEPYTYDKGEQTYGNGTERFNTKSYNWQNTGTSTISGDVYHQTHTETFSMQVNMANTGVYDSGGGTVEGIYTINLKHPTLSVNFDGNGATSGSAGTQTYTYNESKDLWNVGGSNLNFAKTNYTTVSGSEWNKKADGTGTAYNQATSYAATSLKDFTDGDKFTSKSLTLYAQWKIGNAGYTVKHWKQKAGGTAGVHDGNNYDLAETEIFSAQIGSTVTPAVKSYTGYSSPAAQSGTVAADGSLVINYYYDLQYAGYTVNHWKQKTTGTVGVHNTDNYDLAETETFSAPIGSTVTPAVKSYTNYDSPSVQSGTVAADGSLVINYYYNIKHAVYTVKHWKQKLTGTVGVYDGNNYDLTETENFTAQIGSCVTPAVKSYIGFSSPSTQSGTVAADGSLVINYYYDRNFYSVTLHAGTGIDSVSGGRTYLYGASVSISAVLKEGYHWLNWTGTYTYSDITTTFTMPAQNVDLTANGEANPYTIHFDPNGGTGHIDDIMTTYDTDVTLPDGVAAYKKYTLDGANVTADVESGAISEEVIFSGSREDEIEQEELFSVEAEISAEASEMPEIGREELQAIESTETTETAENEQNSELEDEEIDVEEEQKQADGVSDKTVYSSVFLGWALYEYKDDLQPQWKVGDVVRNLTADYNGEVTLYAVWDDCPWIEAHDLYYSLEQAQSGFITEAEILSHATATDREDGSPILPGINPAVNDPAVNTSFIIPDYQESEFTSMTHDAAVSENLTVVDSSGSTYRKQIMIYVVDTTPQEVKPIGVTRFINEYYYNQPYEYGGLEDNSVWKTNSEYRSALQEAFDNLKNDTPEESYRFSHETILEMKEFIREHGIGNSEEPDALQLFYDTFLEPNRIN